MLKQRQLLKATEVAARLNVSKSTVFNYSVYAAQPVIPMPINMGTEDAPLYRWYEDEIESYLDARTRERDDRAKRLRLIVGAG